MNAGGPKWMCGKGAIYVNKFWARHKHWRVSLTLDFKQRFIRHRSCQPIRWRWRSITTWPTPKTTYIQPQRKQDGTLQRQFLLMILQVQGSYLLTHFPWHSPKQFQQLWAIKSYTYDSEWCFTPYSFVRLADSMEVRGNQAGPRGKTLTIRTLIHDFPTNYTVMNCTGIIDGPSKKTDWLI